MTKCNCIELGVECELACPNKICPGSDSVNCREHPEYIKDKDDDGPEPEGPGT